MIVKARTKANLSVAMGLTELEYPAFNKLRRPSSAPTTPIESKDARRHILTHDFHEDKKRREAMEDTHAGDIREENRRLRSAQDYSEGRRKQERKLSPRPKSCLPKFHTTDCS